MGEIRKEVIPVMVSISCDVCNTIMIGIDSNTEQIDDGSYETLYLYKCPNCGYEYISPIRYPYVDYEEVKSNE